MSSDTKERAQLFNLWAAVSKMVVDGKRSTAVVAKALQQIVSSMFTTLVRADDTRTTEEVLAATPHTYVNPNITSTLFPRRRREAGTREWVVIEGDEFDHDPTSEEVFALAAARGLIRPSYEDALDFDEQHPDEQGVLVFLHEPVRVPGARPSVVCLVRFGADRRVRLFWSGDGWVRAFRSGFLRPPASQSGKSA